MSNLFYQLSFSSSGMKSKIILNCISILEKSDLIPRLEYFISGPEDERGDAKSIKIENRESWIEEKISKKESISIYSELNIMIPSRADLFVSTGFIKFQGRNTERCVFTLTTKNTVANSDLLFKSISEIAPEIFAYFGEITPDEMKTATSDQIVWPHEKNRKPKYDLPVLKIPNFLSGPEIPLFFGWINYWSKETVNAVGFSKETNSQFFYRTEELSSGGFILQLTEEPLNLEIEEHLKILKNAYERFPKVGGRDTPFDYLK